jgi:hypothetical protein
MLAQRRSIWPTLLLLAALAALILAVTSADLRSPLSLYRAAPQPAQGMAVLERKLEARVCVTRQGFCAAPTARIGDPCSCPHLLRGMVPGHIERVGGTPVRPLADWESRGDRDGGYDAELPAGP